MKDCKWQGGIRYKTGPPDANDCREVCVLRKLMTALPFHVDN